MRKIQMILSNELVQSVDQAAKKLDISRSAFVELALKQALRNIKTKQLEHLHRQGYQNQPSIRSEASLWKNEQSWGDL